MYKHITCQQNGVQIRNNVIAKITYLLILNSIRNTVHGEHRLLLILYTISNLQILYKFVINLNG
jgi:hypothetical protein